MMTRSRGHIQNRRLLGQRSACRHCGRPIIYGEHGWRHRSLDGAFLCRDARGNRLWTLAEPQS